MGKRTCSIHGCEREHAALFLCQMHYERLRNTGTTNLRVRVPKVCRMPSCDKKATKRRWCGKHWNRIRKNGSPLDRHQKWVLKDYPACTVCGGEIQVGNGFRRYCGRSCAVLANRGQRPTAISCAQCGVEVDMTIRNERGYLMNSSLSRCHDCRKGVNLRGYVSRLLERDGTACSLCGEDIDMTLKYPHPKSRSVDHVLPRSLGGTEDMSNLALACLTCNVSKQARMDWAPAA